MRRDEQAEQRGLPGQGAYSVQGDTSAETHHHTRVQTRTRYNTKREPRVNGGPWVVTTSQWSFTSCNEQQLCGADDRGEAPCAWGRAGAGRDTGNLCAFLSISPGT